MMDVKDIKEVAQVAIDAYHGNVAKYSVSQSDKLVKDALLELNNGKKYLDYRDLRDGKCPGLFTLVEEVLERTTLETLTGSEFFFNLVDYRNLAEGDENVFDIEDSTMFVMSDIANGTQGLRRQRISGIEQKVVPTRRKGLKIYEELDRILAGRVDFNKLIKKASDATVRQVNDEIYSLWTKATQADFGGQTYFPTAGAYSESALLDVIAHVEAAADGKPAVIITTKKGARRLAPSIQGADSKSDLYNLGLTTIIVPVH